MKLEKVEENLKKYLELEKYVLTIQKDKEQLENLEKIIIDKKENVWENLYQKSQELYFEKWPVDRKVTIDYKNIAKEIRDKVKKSLTNTMQKSMVYSSKEANETILKMYLVLVYLKNIVLEFEAKFQEKKKEKNRIDFHDIEHFALKILVEKEEEGKIIPSKVAKELQNKFLEIAIDEYQDSNLVQEYILNSVSKGNNIFMVGDIKQSIYRFREARPELFIEKYKKYSLIEENSKNKSEMGHKIKLFKNFRSRKEVLNLTNWVFNEIMSQKLGDVEYNKDEYLNLGANYDEENSKICIPELHILNLAKKDDEEEQEETQIIEKNEEEAKMLANKIEELMKSDFMVNDKKRGKRKLEYRDIVILLRSTTNIAPIYEKELVNRGMPVFCDTSTEYLESSEIQTILALLKIIDNPMQDIPLVTVLRSPIGNFTDNDLVNIRLTDRNSYFYEALLKSRISVEGDLKKKIETFLENMQNWRELEKEKPLDEFIWQIYQDTNYYHYVGLLNNGGLKQANLKMLFERAKQYETASFKGLYNFIHFLDRLKLSSKDLSSAKIVGENDNVIRIMSIHKSKGLEFPVVCLCGTGKQFNKQDLNETILLHQDLGFGPKYIDSKNRIEIPTLAKEAIKLKAETELISEEMRVLYVALTRAKEKLIITGTIKDFEKSCKDKENMLSLYVKQEEQEKIQERLLKKYTSYLDWLTLLVLKNKEQKLINVEIHKVQEYKQESKVEEVNKQEEKIKVNNKELEKIKKELEWEYPHLISSKIPTKTSVSKIKEENQDEIDIEELISKKVNYHFETPNFMIKDNKTQISSSRKGTLVHLCMQKLDSKKEYTKQDIEKLVQELVDKEIILKEEAKVIPIDKIEKYLKSSLWNNLKNAKEIHKEEPFYLQLSANKININYPKEDSILVQGIIDLYYISNNNELVLVDYKTDYVEKGKEMKLVKKYKKQLELYKEALEKSFNRKVDKVMIYSTWIEEIEIP